MLITKRSRLAGRSGLGPPLCPPPETEPPFLNIVNQLAVWMSRGAFTKGSQLMAKLKLGEIKDGKDKNRYCGPSVVSAVTDLTTGEAARLIRIQTGAKKITGTSSSEVHRALRACNISVKRRYYSGLNRTTGPTLAGWLRMSKADRTAGRVFLIVAGWHWQLVSGRKYTCGRIREIVSIRDKRVKRRARVAEVYELISDKVTKPDIDVSRPKDLGASDRAKSQRIAKRIKATIEIARCGDYTDYWVYPPDGLFNEDDDCAWSYCQHNWQEVLELLQIYEDMISKRETHR
jgi:hypothetical protein